MNLSQDFSLATVKLDRRQIVTPLHTAPKKTHDTQPALKLFELPYKQSPVPVD